VAPVPSFIIFTFLISYTKQDFEQCLCLLQHGCWENLSTEGIGGKIEVRPTYLLLSLSAPNSKLIIGILILNMCLILPLLTASINGFDSSLVNGKSGEPWQFFF
jgi:hypothetical protein